jgi:hypothetical protein
MEPKYFLEPLKTPLPRVKLVRIKTPQGWLIKADAKMPRNSERGQAFGFHHAKLYFDDPQHRWNSITDWETVLKIPHHWMYRSRIPGGWLVLSVSLQGTRRAYGAFNRILLWGGSVDLTFVPDPKGDWLQVEELILSSGIALVDGPCHGLRKRFSLALLSSDFQLVQRAVTDIVTHVDRHHRDDGKVLIFTETDLEIPEALTVITQPNALTPGVSFYQHIRQRSIELQQEHRILLIVVVVRSALSQNEVNDLAVDLNIPVLLGLDFETETRSLPSCLKINPRSSGAEPNANAVIGKYHVLRLARLGIRTKAKRLLILEKNPDDADAIEYSLFE